MLNITNKWWISLPAKKGQDILIKCECGHNFSIDSQTIEDMHNALESGMFGMHRCPNCLNDVFGIELEYKMYLTMKSNYTIISEKFIKEY